MIFVCVVLVFDEIAILTIQECYNLSVLMYAVPAATLSSKKLMNWMFVGTLLWIQQMGVCEGCLDGAWQTQH